VHDTQTALPGLENPGQNAGIPGGYGAGPAETEIRAQIAEIERDAPLTGYARTLKLVAITAAANVDAANRKGRAAAHELTAMREAMRDLQVTDDDGAAPDDSNLTPETRRLLDAFAAPARLDPAPEGHAAEL
jgi:hypothetical protein